MSDFESRWRRLSETNRLWMEAHPGWARGIWDDLGFTGRHEEIQRQINEMANRARIMVEHPPRTRQQMRRDRWAERVRHWRLRLAQWVAGDDWPEDR